MTAHAITCTKTLTWCAGHRLEHHDGPCRFLHGHNYKAEITVAGEVTPVGYVIDFGVIKSLVGGWIDENWDHAFLLDVDDPAVAVVRPVNGDRLFLCDAPPTAEYMARKLCEVARDLLPDTIDVVSVTVWETPTGCATAMPFDVNTLGGEDR